MFLIIMFQQFGPEVEKKITIVPGSFKDYFNRRDVNGRFLINPSNSSFFLLSTVPVEIERLIDDLDVGANSIPVYIFKLLKPFFYWLSEVIYLSFKIGVFPGCTSSQKWM